MAAIFVAAAAGAAVAPSEAAYSGPTAASKIDGSSRHTVKEAGGVIAHWTVSRRLSIFDTLSDRESFASVQWHSPVNGVRRPHYGLRALNPRGLRWGLDHGFAEIVNVIFKG